MPNTPNPAVEDPVSFHHSLTAPIDRNTLEPDSDERERQIKPLVGAWIHSHLVLEIFPIHDRRNDPSNFKHVWYMDISSNGGLTFGTDRRIGNFQTQPDSFIGDYAGLAAENDLVLPMWWDSRNSSSGDPYTAKLKPPQL